VERGDLGVKTGRGFYAYPDPAFAQPGFSGIRKR
jgi:3-hydroxybutyryl-CoA dehydrogenase